MPIPIDADSLKTGTIVSLTQVVDVNGDPAGITENIIVDAHDVDIQDASVNDIIESQQLNVSVSHKIYPDEGEKFVDLVIILEHFYKINDKYYRITWIHNFGTVVYFSAVYKDFGRTTTP